jgi:ABC-type multidrug transport system fused ATPase/permease subunit
MLFIQVFNLFDARGRVTWIALVTITVLTSLLDGVGLSALVVGMKVVLEPAVLSKYAVSRSLMNHLPPLSQTELSLWVFGSLAAFYLIKNVLAGIVFSASQRFIWAQRSRLAELLFRNYLEQNYDEHINVSTSTLQRNINAVGRICEYVLVPMVFLYSDVIVVGSMTLAMLIMQPVMTVGLVVLVGLAALFHLSTRHRMARWSTINENSEARILSLTNQSFSAFRDIRLYNRTAFFASLFRNSVEEHSHVREKFQVYANLPRLVTETAMISGFSLVMVAVILSGQNIIAVMPFAAALVAAATRTAPSINRMANSLSTIRFGRTAFEEVYPDLVATVAKGETPVNEQRIEAQPFTREIILDNVGYRYPGTDKWALRHVSLTIQLNESIGVAGPSGSGKTTLAHILLGFLTPSEGRMLVDGVDISTQPDRWKQNVAFVPQDVFLMETNLAQNISFGALNTAETEDRIRHAIAIANLEEVLANQPEGLETEVGERGVRLSGGQRQRVAIARAMFYQRKLLVLDEATAALDTRTERSITKAIEQLHHRSTTVVIAHRLSTIRNCDRIVLLADGKIEAIGGYMDLARNNSLFAELVAEQSIAAQ